MRFPREPELVALKRVGVGTAEYIFGASGSDVYSLASGLNLCKLYGILLHSQIPIEHLPCIGRLRIAEPTTLYLASDHDDKSSWQHTSDCLRVRELWSEWQRARVTLTAESQLISSPKSQFITRYDAMLFATVTKKSLEEGYHLQERNLAHLVGVSAQEQHL